MPTDIWHDLEIALDQFIRRGSQDDKVEARWFASQCEIFRAQMTRVRSTVLMSLPLDSVMTEEEQNAAAKHRLQEIAGAQAGIEMQAKTLAAEAESIRQAIGEIEQ